MKQEVKPLSLNGYPDVLTTGEIAEIMRVDHKTVGRWCKEGKLKHFRTVGGHRRVEKSEFIKALAAAQIAKWSDDVDEHDEQASVGGPGDAGDSAPDSGVATTGTRPKGNRPIRRGGVRKAIVVDPS